MRRWCFVLLALMMLAGGIHAQDGLNLPTELYTLKRDGTIERFGLGAVGVTNVTPPGALTVDFGVSPDGVWLAYRTESAVGIYNMRTGEQRPLDTTGASFPPYRGRGQSIAWSPDGGAIAYTTEYGLRTAFLAGGFADVTISPLLDLIWSPDGSYLAAEAEMNIWWVYRREPTEMVLHAAIPSSRGLTWASATQLLFAPAEGGLYSMDVAAANQQTTLDNSVTRYAMPERRQNGTVALFIRPEDARGITDTAGYLWEIAAGQNGPMLQEVSGQSVELTSMRWAPGGRLLVTLSSGVLALVDPVSAQGYPLPVTDVVSYSWGAARLPSIPNLPLTSVVHFLGDDGTGLTQVWKLTPDGAPATPITAHDTSISAYDVGSDGRTVAYISEDTLWVLTPDPEIATPLLTEEGIAAPAFNADSTRIAYQTASGIGLIDIVGGEPENILEGYTAPQFIGGRLLVRMSDGDLGIYDFETGDIQRLGTFKNAKLMPDGRMLLAGAPTSALPDGIYMLDTALASSTPILLYESPDGLTVRDFAGTPDGGVRLLMARIDGMPGPVRIFDVPFGGIPVSIPTVPYLNEASISSDGGTLAGFASGAGTLAVYSMPLSSESVIVVPSHVDKISFPSFR